MGTVTAVPVEDVEVDEHSEVESPWMCIVWNDPVNLMSYVTFVFMTYFGFPREKAERLMLDVHEKGRAVVASGSRDRMERDVTAMHAYGLWATVSREM